MRNYTFFIGIDVSKEWIDVAYSTSSKPIYLGQFDNTLTGFEQMLNQLDRLSNQVKQSWLICFENTGQYSKDLLEFLCQKQIPRCEGDPAFISKNIQFKRGKDDKTDAMAICQFAYRFQEELELSVPMDEKCQRISRLLARRDLLVKHLTTLKNDMKENKRGFSEKEYELIFQSNQELVNMYNAQIKQTEQLIKKTLKEDEQMKKNNELIQSVKGVGPIISAYIIALTRNFERFDFNARKFACFCGIAPFPFSSGKFKGKDRVNKRGHKKMKALLSNGATVAVTFDPQTKLYYQRKKEEGKAYGSILNAIKNKLIARIFAVVRRQTPYVDIFAYK